MILKQLYQNKSVPTVTVVEKMGTLTKAKSCQKAKKQMFSPSQEKQRHVGAIIAPCFAE